MGKGSIVISLPVDISDARYVLVGKRQVVIELDDSPAFVLTGTAAREVVNEIMRGAGKRNSPPKGSSLHGKKLKPKPPTRSRQLSMQMAAGSSYGGDRSDGRDARLG